MYDPIDPKIIRDSHLKLRGSHFGTDAEGGASELRAELKALMNILLWRGRVRRLGYWVLLASGFTGWVCLMIMGLDVQESNEQWSNRISIYGTLFALYFLAALVAARLRDIGQTPWLVVLAILFLPLGAFPLVALGLATTKTTKKDVGAAWVGSEAGEALLD